MRNVLLAVLVLVTVACGAYRFPGSGSAGTGAVSGTVVALPCLPVEQATGQAPPLCVGPCWPVAQPSAQAMPQCANPCPPVAQGAAQAMPLCASPCVPIDQPAGQALPQCGGRPVAGLEIDFARGADAAKAVTDSNGHYTATLAAGTWSVHVVTNSRVISGPAQVIVTSGSTVNANYVIDSGIRVPVPLPQQ